MEPLIIEGMGMIGSLLLLSAWLYETYRTLKKGEKLNVTFTGIYTLGLIFLVYYSYSINSVPFLILNGVILFITLFELDIAFRHRKKSR